MNLNENSVPRNKAWEEPWTTDEIRNNATNWSLAGDAGLLLFMENFSNNLVSKINETLVNIDSLSENVSNTQIKLNNVTNHFMSLNHTQFIENRVYEEDETADTYNSSKNSQKKDEINTSNQTDKLELMCKAVEKSLGILNTHFERVDISDSEDDSGEASNTIYNLKDPYSDRSLPYPLGSELWHGKDHIGLQHSESTESINEQNDFESDEKSNSLKNYKSVLDYLSDSGSDLEFSLPIDSAKAENNGTYSNEVEKDLFTSTSNSDFDVPVKENKKVEATANMNFVEELAAKLGNVVAATNQSKTPEVIQSKSDTKKKVSGQYEQNIFSDEPPPMDQFDKSLQANEYTEGGLFDDLDDPLWGMSYKDDEDTGIKQNAPNNKTGQKPKIDSLFENKADEDDLFVEITKKITERETSNTITSTPDEKSKATSIPSKGLFDDSDSDDLFKIPDNVSQIKSSNVSKTTGDSLPYLEKEETKRKKLVGEKSLFAGQNDLFNQNINKLLKESKLLSPKKNKDNEINVPTVEKEEEVIPPETKIKKSKSVDIFEDEKIDQPNKNKKIMSLFEDDDDDMFDFLIKKDVKKAPSNDSTKEITNVETDSIKTSTGNKNEKPAESKSSGIVKNKEETIVKDKKNIKDDFISNLSSNIFNDEPPEIDEDKSEFDDQYERDYSEPKLGFMQSNSSQMYFDEPPPLNDHFEGSSGVGTETSSNRLQDDNDLFQPTLNSTAQIVKDEKDSLFDDINSKLSTTKTFDNKQKSNISNLFDDNNSDDIFSLNKKPSSNLLSVEANDDLFSNINTVEKTDKSKATISSIFEDEDDIFKEIKKDDSSKKNNIIQESLFKSLDVDDNLFSNVQNSNIVDEILNKNDKKIFDEKNSNDSTKSQPKNSSENIVSAFLNKIESKTDEVDGNKQSAAKSPPGKIKHNLNINVAALAPGATFVKPNVEKSVDLNSSVGNVETLPVAAHKERVRIPVKRRPSTRQARQKSIRNSGIDFLPITPDDTDSNIVKNEFVAHSNEDNFCTECANIETENVEVIDSPILNTYLHLAESENINNINIQNEIERNNAAANMVENIVAEERSTEDTYFSKNDNGNLVTAERLTEDESNASSSRDLVKKHVANILFEDDNDSLFSSNLQTKEDDIFGSVKETKSTFSDEDDDIFKSLSKEKVTFKKDTEQKTVADNIKNDQEKNITEIKKEEKKLVFDDLLSEDDDLFKNKSTSIKKETKKIASNMFSDEDDDLFSAKSSSFSREKVNKASSSMEKEVKNKPKKMSLFNDDDEDLDIFGSSSKSNKTFQSTAPVIQPNRPKKPVAEFVSNDPLSLLHSDDE